jgi:hypothetical protein
MANNRNPKHEQKNTGSFEKGEFCSSQSLDLSSENRRDFSSFLRENQLKRTSPLSGNPYRLKNHAFERGPVSIPNDLFIQGRDTMSFSQRVEKAKPYLTGIVIGLIAAPIIGFSMGWVSTTGSRTEAVQTARIDTLAGICEGAAEKLAAAQSLDLATVKGYENRAKREELVAAALSGITVPDDLLTRVTSGCNRTLA